MGIRADNHLAGSGKALFRQKRVFDAHPTHVVEMGNIVHLDKLTAYSAQLGRFDILAGGGVVQHNRDSIPVKYG